MNSSQQLYLSQQVNQRNNDSLLLLSPKRDDQQESINVSSIYMPISQLSQLVYRNSRDLLADFPLDLVQQQQCYEIEQVQNLKNPIQNDNNLQIINPLIEVNQIQQQLPQLKNKEIEPSKQQIENNEKLKQNPFELSQNKENNNIKHNQNQSKLFEIQKYQSSKKIQYQNTCQYETKMKMKVTENENEELNVCNDIMETDMKKTEFKKKNKQNHNLICACPIQ